MAACHVGESDAIFFAACLTGFFLCDIIMPNIWTKGSAGAVDARKMKAAAEWFHSQVFRDEG